MEIYSENLVESQDESEPSLLFQNSFPSQSQTLGWYDGSIASIQRAAFFDPNPSLNVFESDLPVGVVVQSVDAVGWRPGFRNVDVRPRLVGSDGRARLIDSGAMITATTRLPEDKEDNSVRLIAVNGSQIKTYGMRTIEVKIGRKAYSMPAVICDIEQDILGMDFLSRYKLGFEWDGVDQSELYLVDKKAQISKLLKTVTVPTDLQRTHHFSTEFNFDLLCICCEEVPMP